jgi:hypothetical protein
MAQSNVPVMQSVRAAYTFWRTYWRPVAGALAVFAVVTALQVYWNTTGQTGLSFLGTLMSVAASTMAMGALYRLAFADEHPGDPGFQPGPFGLQWGAMEWRLLGATLLIFLLLIIAMVVFFFLVMLAVVMLAGSGAIGADTDPQELARALGAPGAILLLLLMTVLLVTVIYAAVRLVLVPAATASSGKVQVFETWPLTKGQFWPILGAVVLVSLPSIIAGVLTAAISSTATEEGPVDGTHVLPAATALVVALLSGAVTAFVQAPLTAGLGAYLYRGLRSDGQEARAQAAPGS